MRAGWVGNTELIDRVHNIDKGARVIIEAIRTVNEDLKDTFDDWNAADSTTGFVILNRGGARLSGADATQVTNATDNGAYITDLNRDSPFEVAEVVWGGAEPEFTEIHQLVARLVARRDGGQPLEVTDWRAQLFRVSRVSAHPQTAKTRYELQPITAQDTVVATGGTTPGDVTFNFLVDGVAPLVHNPPLDGATEEPRTIVMVWAMKADGSSAANVGWAVDNAVSSKTSGAHTINRLTLEGIDDEFELQLGSSKLEITATPTGVPRFSLKGRSFSSSTIAFTSGNLVDLGAAPGGSSLLEVVVAAETPGGSSVAVRLNDGVSWFAVNDGDIIGANNTGTGGADLTSMVRKQTYQMDVTFTPPVSGDVTPAIRKVGVREYTLIDLDGLTAVPEVAWSVDPLTMKGEITRPIVAIIRDGEADYRDAASELFARQYIGEVQLRAFIGHPDLDRKRWLHIDTWDPRDYSSPGAAVVVECIGQNARLDAELPVFQTGPAKLEPLEYTNQTIKAAYEDILSGQLGIPARFLGASIEDATTVTKRIESSNAKEEVEALARLAGGGLIPSQGRIKFVTMHSDEPPVAAFDRSELKILALSPGYQFRVPEFFVPHDWDTAAESYLSELRVFHATSLTKFGNLERIEPGKLDDVVARWIDSEALARTMAQRTISTVGTGLFLVMFRTNYAHPFLEPGDNIAVQTDKLVARDPNDPKELRGLFWLFCTVATVHDVWGTTFTAWVRSYADIQPGDTTVTVLNFRKPKVVSIHPEWKADGALSIQVVTDFAGSVKAADSATAPFPTRATVRGKVAVATDAEGYAEVLAGLGTYEPGDEMWISVLAFETATATGAESAVLFTLKIQRPAPNGVWVRPTVTYLPVAGSSSTPLWKIDASLDVGPNVASLHVEVDYLIADPPNPATPVDVDYDLDLVTTGVDENHRVQDGATPTMADILIDHQAIGGVDVKIRPYNAIGGAGGAGLAGPRRTRHLEDPTQTGATGVRIDDGTTVLEAVSMKIDTDDFKFTTQTDGRPFMELATTLKGDRQFNLGAAGGGDVQIHFETTPITGAGGVGIQIDRLTGDSSNLPAGISFARAGTERWFFGLDQDRVTTTPDLALHMGTTGDVMRFKEGGHVNVGKGVGDPLTAYIFGIHDFTGSGVTDMLRLHIPADADHAITLQTTSAVFQVDALGRVGVGKEANSNFGFQVKGSWPVHLGLTDANPIAQVENAALSIWTDGNNLIFAVRKGDAGAESVTIAWD